MNILVTGITGHTGQWFLKALEENNFDGEVNVVVRPTSNSKQLEESNLNIIKHIGDIEDNSFLDKVTQNIDTIIHIYNINHSLEVVKSAVKNKVDWFIGVHTTGVYSQFKSASEGYKKIEEELEKYRDQINITILRPTMIYGSSKDHNMFKLINFIDKSPIFPMFGNGKNLMQPVTAYDLGYAYFNVMINPEITKNKSYNLPGKYPITYKQLVKTVANRLNKNITFLHIPIGVSFRLASLAEKVPGFPISGEQVLRMKENKDFTYLSAQQDFGYTPMSFDEGIDSEIEEYLSKKVNKNEKSI